MHLKVDKKSQVQKQRVVLCRFTRFILQVSFRMKCTFRTVSILWELKHLSQSIKTTKSEKTQIVHKNKPQKSVQKTKKRKSERKRKIAHTKRK